MEIYRLSVGAADVLLLFLFADNAADGALRSKVYFR